MTSSCAQYFMGPSQDELIDLLRGPDAAGQLPVLLGLGAPRAIVIVDASGWTLRRLVVPDASTTATQTRFLGGFVPGESILCAPSSAALADAVAAMDWSYGPEFPAMQLTVDISPQEGVVHPDLQLALLGTGTVLYVGRAQVACCGRKIAHATSQQVHAVLELIDSPDFVALLQHEPATKPAKIALHLELKRNDAHYQLSCDLAEQPPLLVQQLWQQVQMLAQSQGWLEPQSTRSL